MREFEVVVVEQTPLHLLPGGQSVLSDVWQDFAHQGPRPDEIHEHRRWRREH